MDKRSRFGVFVHLVLGGDGLSAANGELHLIAFVFERVHARFFHDNTVVFGLHPCLDGGAFGGIGHKSGIVGGKYAVAVETVCLSGNARAFAHLSANLNIGHCLAAFKCHAAIYVACRGAETYFVVLIRAAYRLVAAGGDCNNLVFVNHTRNRLGVGVGVIR